MDKTFDICVEMLMWLANLTGFTYKEINIIIFVILEPLVFFIMLYFVIKYFRLKKRLKK